MSLEADDAWNTGLATVVVVVVPLPRRRPDVDVVAEPGGTGVSVANTRT